MTLHFSQSDRTYMRHFFIGIGLLGLATVIEIVIATFVFVGAPKDPHHIQEMSAGSRITPIGAVYSGATGQAAVKAATDAATPAAPAASAEVATGPYKYDEAKGKSLFDGTCAACHQATGEGVPGTFPPLKANPAVTGADPATQLETILHGRQGSTIMGVKYTSVMPPFAGQFSDLQIADIANYERSSWGNHGKHVTPEDVAKARAKK